MPAPDEGPCPLCGQPLYGWATLPDAPGQASVGMRTPPEAGTRVLDRCEECGVGVERGDRIDLEAELRAVSRSNEAGEVTVDSPNRASLQAFLGGSAWTPLDRLPGRLALTPRSLELLAERTGHELGGVSYPPTPRNLGWMWQTIINAFTFHNNFARDLLAGRIRPAGGRRTAMFVIDALISVLAAPVVALIAVPLEAISSLLNRGGRMIVRLERDSGSGARPPR